MNQKNIIQKIVFAMLCFSVSAYAQTGRVGINTTSPKATLDIVAKTTDGSQAEGFIAPRLTGNQIKLADAQYNEAGTIVYATAAASPTTTKTAAITAPGYYYYNGTAWQPVSSSNIYNANGTLSADRTVTQAANSLTFSSAKGSPVINSADGLLDLQGITNSAMIVSRVAKTADVTSPKNGMVIYDEEYKCFKFYENNAWTPCLSSSSSSSSATVVADCNVNGFAGSYVNGAAMTAANKFSVTITNNTFSTANLTFQSSDLALSDAGVTVSSVSPSTATLTAGQSVLVEYTLSGAPTASGTLTGTWTNLSLSCTKTVTVNLAPFTDLTCPSAASIPTITRGVTYTTASTGNTFSISYTGGDSTAYPSQSFPSTGVTGLSAVLDAGNYTPGGSLLFRIIGTTTSTGTASFAINIAGKSCTINVTVSSGSVTISFPGIRVYTLASVYDADYLPYTAPPTTVRAVLQTASIATPADGVASGAPNEPIIDVQGTIDTTTGVNVKIRVSASGTGTLPAFSQTFDVNPAYTQDGNNSVQLNLSWPQINYTSSTKYIDATIKAVGSTFYAKKLDINSGVGGNGKGIDVGYFDLPTDSGYYATPSAATKYYVRIVAPVPDRMFQTPNAGTTTTYSHRMFYVPMELEDGRVWLSNNLGADYTNYDKPVFGLAKQANGRQDFNGYGGLFQWGRKADGHELINWSNATTGAAVNAAINATPIDVPIDTRFITNGTNDWRSTSNNDLWKDTAGVNNPCPDGFLVPLSTWLNSYISSLNAFITNRNEANISNMRFTTPGLRNASGSLTSLGNEGHYWTSISSGSDTATKLEMTLTGAAPGVLKARVIGASVRCSK